MRICDKCREPNNTIGIYLFGKYNGDKLAFELCEPCAKEVKQKIKDLINNENV